MACKVKKVPNGGGTIRKRSDGRWEARYTNGFDPKTGKQLQKSVYGKTQADVRKKLQAVCSAINTGNYIEPSKLTVGNWFDIWLKEYTGSIKPLTLKSYTVAINNHIKPSLGAIKLSSLGTHSIQAFYNKLLNGSEEIAGLSPKTIKNVHGVVHKALQQACEINYLNANPSNACKLPRVEKTKIKPMEETEISNFIKAIKGHQFENLYLFTLFTGMRQGEVLGLTWDSVDLQNGTILIYQQLQRIDGVYKFVSLKNDKSRNITLPPFIIKLLQEHKAMQNQWRLLAGSSWDNSNHVFSNQLGGHLAHVTVSTNYKKIVKSIGLPDARFHDLRHSYAVAALQSGDDIKTVQENLGHHTASFTLDVYGHVSDRMKIDSANRMENFIKTVHEIS